jgi:hypothetical protein
MSGVVNTTHSRERLVKARKQRRCEDYTCRRTIEVGELYLLCTEYPGSDIGYADAAGHPVRLHICHECAPTKFPKESSDV